MVSRALGMLPYLSAESQKVEMIGLTLDGWGSYPQRRLDQEVCGDQWIQPALCPAGGVCARPSAGEPSSSSSSSLLLLCLAHQVDASSDVVVVSPTQSATNTVDDDKMSDVYSMGVVFWEVFSREVCRDDRSWSIESRCGAHLTLCIVARRGRFRGRTRRTTTSR